MSSGQPGRYQRSSGGLIGAMLVLLVVIAGFVVFRAVTRGNQDEPVPSVAYAAAVRAARADGALLAPAPASMPAGWRATSVRYQGGARPTWHLGLLTDDDTYVGIEESRSRTSRLVDSYLGQDADQEAARQIGDRTWQSWRLGRAYALTWTRGSDTVFVGGRAGEAKVVELVGALEIAGSTPG